MITDCHLIPFGTKTVFNIADESGNEDSQVNPHQHWHVIKLNVKDNLIFVYVG